MKPLTDFASRFGGKVALNPEFILEKANRFYLLRPVLRKITRGDFYHSGLYLGKIKNGTFFPSFNLLNMVTPFANNKVVLDRKAAWLFICGRDVFRKGIIKFTGCRQRGDYALVMNEFGECLGFGVVTGNFEENGKVAVRNLLDIGDFLRRET